MYFLFCTVPYWRYSTLIWLGSFFLLFVVVVVWLGFCLFVFHNLTKSSFVVCLFVFICNGSFLCLTLQHWITGKNHTGSSLPPKEQHWLLNFGFLIRYKLKIANQLVFNCIKRGPQRKLTWKQVFLFADSGCLFSQYSCIRRLFIIIIFFLHICIWVLQGLAMIQFSSLSSRWYLCAWKCPYALHPVSQKFSRRLLWNGSSVRLIDNGPLFEGRSLSASSFHTSMIYSLPVKSMEQEKVGIWCIKHLCHMCLTRHKMAAFMDTFFFPSTFTWIFKKLDR